MAETFLSNEGYIVVSREHFESGGREFITSPFTPQWDNALACASDFQVEASGLDPNEDYLIRLVRVEDAQHRLLPLNPTDPSYPNDWTPQDQNPNVSGRYSWPNLIADAQGELSETLLDTFETTDTGYGGASAELLGRTLPSGAWEFVSPYSPDYALDANYGLEKRRLADFPNNLPTEKDGRVLNLACVKYRVAYTLELLKNASILVKTVKIVVDYVRCVDTLLDEEVSGSGKAHLMTIPVDLSLDADANQVWTPVVDQACAVVTPSKPFVYSEAMRRDFATAPADNLQIHTLEIYCAEDPQQESYFLCNDLQDHTLTTEEGEARIFQAANFSFTLPQTNGDGAPEMQVAISNINGEVFSYIDRVRDFGPIVIKYRPFLANDTSAPQTTHPLTLFLSEISADPFQVTGRVSFVDILNKSFPSIKYNIDNFPNIYG